MRTLTFLAVSTGLLLALVAHSPSAAACGNAIFKVKNSTIRALQAADKLVENGRLRQGIRRISKLSFRSASHRIPKKNGVKSKAFMKSRDEVRSHLQRRDGIVALAIVRSGGKYDKKGLKVRRESARENTLKGATRVLNQKSKRRAGNKPSTGLEPSPRARAYYAEALAAMGETEQALKLLTKLASTELMPSAWGYGVLASLRHGDGDIEGAKNALDACVKMASKPRKACPRF
jgi:hypothetical protein